MPLYYGFDGISFTIFDLSRQLLPFVPSVPLRFPLGVSQYTRAVQWVVRVFRFSIFKAIPLRTLLRIQRVYIMHTHAGIEIVENNETSRKCVVSVSYLLIFFRQRLHVVYLDKNTDDRNLYVLHLY